MDSLFEEESLFEFEIEEELTEEGDVKDDSNTGEMSNQSCETTIQGSDARDYFKFGPYIPKEDGGYTETQCIQIDGSDPIEVTFKIPPKPILEHEIDMWDIINEFEVDAWSSKSAGLKTGWESIDHAFDGGIKNGFIVIAADSNIGKTAVMSQMAWQIVENNPNAYVMDFSLDDPMPDKLSRVVAAGSKVLLNAVKNPNNYTEMPLMLARRQQSLNKLRKYVDRYRAYDANFTTNIEEIEEEIQRKLIELEQAGLEKQVVVFIDNLHDLNIKSSPSISDKQMKYDIIAQWCADTAIRYNIPVICTAELRKINGAKRPELDDIRECVKIKYEAKAVIMVYNEVHYKGDAAEVFYLRQSSPMKQPVLELHFAKNKMSSFKGRLFFEFYPEMARLEEPDDQTTKRYASLVYS